MNKKLTCIECPRGCVLSVDAENGKLVRLEGYECPKGEKYAIAEIENPTRILTSTVLTEGLFLKMIPVRTSDPIPKSDIKKAMSEIIKIRIKHSIRTGDVIIKDFLGSGADLIATRDCSV